MISYQYNINEIFSFMPYRNTAYFHLRDELPTNLSHKIEIEVYANVSFLAATSTDIDFESISS